MSGRRMPPGSCLKRCVNYQGGRSDLLDLQIARSRLRAGSGFGVSALGRTACLLVFLAAAGEGRITFDLPDAEGRRHTLAEAAGSKAVVLVFVGVDCPLSRRSAPELIRLFGEYSSRGVMFYAVHSDPSAESEEVERHARQFGYPFLGLLDRKQELARQAGATVTPEAAVISPAGELLYRGRIDDRVVDFGKSRPKPLREDLRGALEEILAGQPVSQSKTKAVGCAIRFPRAPERGGVTFGREVAPILYRHCASCHRREGSAPFSLLSYKDAARRASPIAAVTASRYMPPWKPQPGYGKFEGERRLTNAEIATLQAWAKGGAGEGGQAAPAPPRFPEGWQLGAPDLVAKMPGPFAVPAGGDDIYHCFVIPLGLREDRYVRAMEFRAENPKLVHHALFFTAPSGIARQKAAAEQGLGYPCFGSPGFLPARGLGGWSFGAGPIRLPAAAAAVLPKGSDLVLQLHFHPTGKPEQEQSELALYFAGTPPVKRIVDIPLGSNQIDIPPGEKAYKVRDHFTLPIAVDVIGVIPHAHYLCKDMKGWAVLPGGGRKRLLWIADWDFNWQEQYRYESPVRLPAQSRLEMEFTYDNSEENPRNPNHPPRRVVWGPELTDEMAGLHWQVIPARMPEMPELGEALRGKLMRSLGGRVFR